jgi:hypothetical protein
VEEGDDDADDVDDDDDESEKAILSLDCSDLNRVGEH